jgi:hypothetical protein
MAVEPYVEQSEPKNKDAAIWRFLSMEKFRDLMATGELYFCRADLFDDESEGLPLEPCKFFPELNPFDIRDRQEINNHLGSDAQFREAFYVNCWHLFREETLKMWKGYGEDGVAICSQYSLLKSALNGMDDRAFLGLVRYGLQLRWNVIDFVMTKKIEYAEEREVRAVLWITDPLAGINRHIDIHDRAHPLPLTPPPDRVLQGHRRKVDLQALVTEIMISPWASSATFAEISRLAKDYSIPVQPSALTRFREFLP